MFFILQALLTHFIIRIKIKLLKQKTKTCELEDLKFPLAESLCRFFKTWFTREILYNFQTKPELNEFGFELNEFQLRLKSPKIERRLLIVKH